MPSTQTFRRRIKSVRSTRQITKAMELVAASKMRRASEATTSSRPYADRLWQVLQDLTNTAEEQRLSHPLLEARPVQEVVAVVIASDRGLAGAYNAAVAKRALALAEEQKEAGRTLRFITLGKKIQDLLTRLELPLLQSYTHSSTHPTSAGLAPLVSFLTKSFLEGSVDEVQVIYTEFHSMLRQEVAQSILLPLLPPAPEEKPREFIYEPSEPEVLDLLLPQIIEVKLYQMLQESLASEHSARRLAMHSATDNASSMLDDLTLTYNSLRQGAITQELSEITSGAAALSN